MPYAIRYRDLFAGQDEEMTAYLPTKLPSKLQDTVAGPDKYGAVALKLSAVLSNHVL